LLKDKFRADRNSGAVVTTGNYQKFPGNFDFGKVSCHTLDVLELGEGCVLKSMKLCERQQVSQRRLESHYHVHKRSSLSLSYQILAKTWKILSHLF